MKSKIYLNDVIEFANEDLKAIEYFFGDDHECFRFEMIHCCEKKRSYKAWYLSGDDNEGNERPTDVIWSFDVEDYEVTNVALHRADIYGDDEELKSHSEIKEILAGTKKASKPSGKTAKAAVRLHNQTANANTKEEEEVNSDDSKTEE